MKRLKSCQKTLPARQNTYYKTDYIAHCCPQQEKTKTTEELTRILQSTRDHLESELNRMETEKAHLAAQIQVWEHETQDDTLLVFSAFTLGTLLTCCIRCLKLLFSTITLL